MPTIAENKAAHPEWFVAPEALDADVLQYLAWQGEQPNPVGPGTIADAWAEGGTGPFYAPHALAARQALDHYAEGVAECQATGQTPQAAPWANWIPGSAPQTTGVAASEGGPVFGGS